MTDLSTNNSSQYDSQFSGHSKKIHRGKVLAALISFVSICVVLSPAVKKFKPDLEDSFPLSYYPMFSEKRPNIERVDHIVGIDSQGKTHMISYELAGAGGFNQVRKQIRKIVSSGNTRKLCRTVSANVAEQDKSPYSQIVIVQIVTSGYQLSEYFLYGKKQPIFREVHHSCPVAKRGES